MLEVVISVLPICKQYKNFIPEHFQKNLSICTRFILKTRFYFWIIDYCSADYPRDSRSNIRLIKICVVAHAIAGKRTSRPHLPVILMFK